MSELRDLIRAWYADEIDCEEFASGLLFLQDTDDCVRQAVRGYYDNVLTMTEVVALASQGVNY